MRFWTELDKYKLFGTPFCYNQSCTRGASFNEAVYEKERNT